jgi:uncharacterized membrane protein YidH (DUF202 family)
MDEDIFREQIAAALEAIHSQLVRSVTILEEDTEIDRSIRDLEKKRTDTTSGLLEYTAVTNTLAGHRTDMAKERTALVREQTRLSTKSTELSTIRTELSRERSSLAGQRTDLAVLRTDFSRSRTSLADQRTKMAGDRTRFSEKRTVLAGTRTVFSNMRTALARGRTYLALIRTGLAFLTLSITFFRLFGLSWWSVFDGALGLGSLVMTVIGLTGYWHSVRALRALEGRVPAEERAAA